MPWPGQRADVGQPSRGELLIRQGPCHYAQAKRPCSAQQHNHNLVRQVQVCKGFLMAVMASWLQPCLHQPGICSLAAFRLPPEGPRVNVSSAKLGFRGLSRIVGWPPCGIVYYMAKSSRCLSRWRSRQETQSNTTASVAQIGSDMKPSPR